MVEPAGLQTAPAGGDLVRTAAGEDVLALMRPATYAVGAEALQGAAVAVRAAHGKLEAVEAEAADAPAAPMQLADPKLVPVLRGGIAAVLGAVPADLVAGVGKEVVLYPVPHDRAVAAADHADAHVDRIGAGEA